MASITCANCKATHHSVAEVRSCFTGGGVVTKTRSAHSVSTTPALRPSAVRVPNGWYAINFDGRMRFFKVETPTTGRWDGYTFVKEQAGDDFFPIRGRERRQEVLAHIGLNPAAASKAYGREIGKCGVCGRTLTHPDSIASGIGPVCASKSGW